jgi:hypothetical protein
VNQRRKSRIYPAKLCMIIVAVLVFTGIGPAEEKGGRVLPVKGWWGRRRFLADRAPLLGASIARAQAQRRMDVGRAPITVAPQHGDDAPNRTSIGCAMVGLKMGTGDPMPLNP